MPKPRTGESSIFAKGGDDQIVAEIPTPFSAGGWPGYQASRSRMEFEGMPEVDDLREGVVVEFHNAAGGYDPEDVGKTATVVRAPYYRENSLVMDVILDEWPDRTQAVYLNDKGIVAYESGRWNPVNWTTIVRR